LDAADGGVAVGASRRLVPEALISRAERPEVLGRLGHHVAADHHDHAAGLADVKFMRFTREKYGIYRGNTWIYTDFSREKDVDLQETPMILMVKTMVSCRISHKPIH